MYCYCYFNLLLQILYLFYFCIVLCLYTVMVIKFDLLLCFLLHKYKCHINITTTIYIYPFRFWCEFYTRFSIIIKCLSIYKTGCSNFMILFNSHTTISFTIILFIHSSLKATVCNTKLSWMFMFESLYGYLDSVFTYIYFFSAELESFYFSLCIICFAFYIYNIFYMISLTILKSTQKSWWCYFYFY